MQVPAYVEYEKAASVEHALTLLARFGPVATVRESPGGGTVP